MRDATKREHPLAGHGLPPGGLGHDLDGGHQGQRRFHRHPGRHRQRPVWRRDLRAAGHLQRGHRLRRQGPGDRLHRGLGLHHHRRGQQRQLGGDFRRQRERPGLAGGLHPAQHLLRRDLHRRCQPCVGGHRGHRRGQHLLLRDGRLCGWRFSQLRQLRVQHQHGLQGHGLHRRRRLGQLHGLRLQRQLRLLLWRRHLPGGRRPDAGRRQYRRQLHLLQRLRHLRRGSQRHHHLGHQLRRQLGLLQLRLGHLPGLRLHAHGGRRQLHRQPPLLLQLGLLRRRHLLLRRRGGRDLRQRLQRQLRLLRRRHLRGR